MPYQVFTSESVCAGHPDKICDQISDAIVDAVLAKDPHGRLGVEAAATEGRIILLGEVSTTAKVDYEEVARNVITRLGYTDPSLGFADNAKIDNYIGTQSPEIAQGVDLDGAGDQGMMFGYACRETPELMPLPITLAHRLTRALDTARESGKLPYLRPDGKAQVTVRYENDKPVEVTHVTIAIPHHEDIALTQVRQDIHDQIVTPILAEYGLSVTTENLIVNGTGVWHLPGPRSDAGLTGRKIVVDGYGGYARVGGGAFSGKDPTKVDRSGAYAARYIAKNIVAAGLADRAEVALAYFIGAKRPVMQEVDTFGTAKVSGHEIDAFTQALINTSVAGIIKGLDLRRPIYEATAAYGHFGRADFPWEAVKAPKSHESRVVYV
jgi:S-adenosylmethionine synthetase